MKSARKSLFRDLVVRFSILVFSLLVILSGVWFWFWKAQLAQKSAISESASLAYLYQSSIFILVLIGVITAAAVILGLIFFEGLRSNLADLIKQLAGMKSVSIGSRIKINPDNELGNLADGVNQVVDNLEKEIAKDLTSAEQEHKHFEEEQNLLSSEQKKIYEEKAKLEYVLARIKDGVILLSKEKKVVVLNKAAEELIGYKQNEANGKPIGSVIKFFEEEREVLPDEYAPKFQAEAAKDEFYQKKHLRIVSPQATEKYADLICTKLTLIQNQDLGYMIVLHDLSARLEIEKKRTELLSSFGKSLKQPLFLLSNNLNSENLNLDTAKAGVAYLACILENLNTVSGIEEGNLSINMEQADFSEIAASALTAVHSIAKSNQVSIEVSEKQDFSTAVSCDKSRMYQIVLNLLFNAIFFTPPEGTVTISFSQADSDIILQIQDSGIGIKSEDMSKLFDKFAVFENNRGIENGIGLGLYICKKLIELQGGKVWLDSVEGRGTVANVSLPKVN